MINVEGGKKRIEDTAYFFPGQGDLRVIKSGGLYDLPPAKRVLANANALYRKGERYRSTHRDLLDIVYSGTQDELRDNAQVAITALNCAAYAVVRQEVEASPRIIFATSIGETAGAHAAGAMSALKAVSFASEREMIMTNEGGEGRMAVISGLGKGLVETICKSAGAFISNTFPFEEHILVSGGIEQVASVVNKAKESKAILAEILNIGYPSHSPLMEKAAKKLLERLSRYRFANLHTDFVMNATNALAGSIKQVKANLARGVKLPVELDKIVSYLLNDPDIGIKRIVEIGPGGSLSKNIRKAKLSVETFVVNTEEGLQKLVKTI